MPFGATRSRETLLVPFQVLRCQAGDETAFRELYEAFSDRTLRHLRTMLDASDAEDVQQEVWLSVYRRISDLANPSGFRTWLFQITRHRAIDLLRSRRSAPESIDEVEEPIDETTMRADEVLMEREDSAGLERAMQELSPVHREVLTLRYREEMSYMDIALVTRTSVGTVRSRIHHAKLNLKTNLDRRTEPVP